MKPSQTCQVPYSELSKYRDRTRALLRRYFRTALEVGRLPSLLGREFFRAKVSSYTMHTFEDAVIFVHDVERCLEKLDPLDQKLIATIIFQDYSPDDVPRLLNCARATVFRRFPEALDELSRMFLGGGLLVEIPCQEPKNVISNASACEQSK